MIDFTGEGLPLNVAWSARSTIRDALAERIPRWLQRPITVITGSAPAPGLPASTPIVRWTTFRMAVVIVLMLVIGVSANIGAGRLRLPLEMIARVVGWIFTIGGARAVQTTLLHDAVHRYAVARRRADRVRYTVLGELASIVLFTQPFLLYVKDHLKHHDDDVFATLDDPDAALLVIELKMLPGTTSEVLRRRLMRMLVSPRFHWALIKARLSSTLGKAPIVRRLATLIFWIPVLGLIGNHNAWLTFVIAWVLPIVFGLQAAALLQFASEHRWLLERDEVTRQVRLARLTSARMCGDPPPPRNLKGLRRVIAWAKWWARFLFVHTLFRIMVLPFDLVHHDLHHSHAIERARRTPGSPTWLSWQNSTYSRRWCGASRPTEIWGLFAAIESTIDTLSKLPPLPITKMTDKDIADCLGM
jgi:hypothetical protein